MFLVPAILEGEQFREMTADYYISIAVSYNYTM